MQHFDFNEALKAIQAGKPITGSDGVLAPLIKQLTEAALSAEIESYLGQNLNSNNRRNGYRFIPPIRLKRCIASFVS
ncbi:hypothetical protein [Suttonella indologenes]|uniref:Transposase, Mutator family n=1 Tax=Suttonella indologenes TaxID=13276 RepID=A0A380MME9_9GAMM|nr:hypothetical protein [Suttonella indologenes]SUO91919.1 Uncharacterised protein [Suttonella indologenes]